MGWVSLRALWPWLETGQYECRKSNYHRTILKHFCHCTTRAEDFLLGSKSEIDHIRFGFGLGFGLGLLLEVRDRIRVRVRRACNYITRGVIMCRSLKAG